MSNRYYLFFTRSELPKPEAHLVQIVQCANGAANLGYATVLAYLNYQSLDGGLSRFFLPTVKGVRGDAIERFYGLQPHLQLLPLKMPWPIDQWQNRLTNSSTIACKYYWPLHLKTKTALVHTRDWNFAKAAIKSEIPVIFECHHYPEKDFEPEFAKSPYLQVVVTVAETVRKNLMHCGIPAKKLLVLANGYNQVFSDRHPEAAAAWRTNLLEGKYPHLIVYSGALFPFKGIDLLLEVAKTISDSLFVFAGGPEPQKQRYEHLAAQRQLSNVKFLGFIQQYELASLLQAADALVHPHLSGTAATFTSPLKLFDYMASGTPIVATKISALSSYENSAGVAAWCNPDDSSQFSTALLRVLQRFPKKPEGYEPQRDFVKQFSWENRIQRILEHIDPSVIASMPVRSVQSEDACLL